MHLPELNELLILLLTVINNFVITAINYYIYYCYTYSYCNHMNNLEIMNIKVKN